jgi:hypothetical protein
LVTLEQIRPLCPLVGENPERASALLDVALEQADDYCRRPLLRATEEAEHGLTASGYYYPRRIPVTEITSLTVEGSLLSEEDYELSDSGKAIDLSETVEVEGEYDVEIAYTGGYEAGNAPQQIRLAMAMAVTKWDELLRAGAASSISSGGETYTFDGDAMRPVRQALNSYRRMSL